MAQPTPLYFVFYIAASAEKVWEGFVSKESNRAIFSAELEAELKPGGSMSWFGTAPDGTRNVFVHGGVPKSDPPKLLQYTFAIGFSDKATKVSIIHDNWAEDDTGYAYCADGRPRILSRLKR